MGMREKLIELCEGVILSCKASLCADCEHNHIDYPNCMGVHFADHLIANGVILDNQVSSSKWIPVSERLPTREDANETESILAINKDEKYVGRWIWDIVVRWPTEFTYWMPLPEPPKEE